MTKNTTTITELRSITTSPYMQDKFKEVLGRKSAGFIASLLSVVSTNDLLSQADPKSILNAAMIAATLDLPINQNLGFAYIIPYNDRKSGLVLAQFQMGYKGFIQLSMRSGQFKTINVSDVKEGEIVTRNRLTGEIQFSWKDAGRDSLKTVGYVAYMSLINGFEKTLYMTVEELQKHGMQYSQSMKKGYGLWKDDFDAMASKTVIKFLLSKYAPLTTEMQTATLADQAVVTGEDQFEYVDNKPESLTDKALESDFQLEEKDVELINSAKDVKSLSLICKKLKEEKGNNYDRPILREFTRKKQDLEGETV